MQLKKHKNYKKQNRHTKKQTNQNPSHPIKTPNHQTYLLLTTEEILKKEFSPVNFYAASYKLFYRKNKKYILNFKKNAENKKLEDKSLSTTKFEKKSLLTKNAESKSLEDKSLTTVSHITTHTSTTIFINNSLLFTKYFSPFTTWTNCTYICSKCMLNYSDEHAYHRHRNRCTKEVGKCIYKQNYIKIYEIYGNKDKQYCRDLCLLGKAFLENKTLYYDVEPFVFYVLFFKEDFVGYFSKERILKTENFSKSEINYDDSKTIISKSEINESEVNCDDNKFDTNKTSINTDTNNTLDTKVLIAGKYNLSCIVVLPTYQGQGYGFMLVDLSYKICVQEGTVGTPEKPLSEAGNACYKKYWKYVVYKNIEMCEDVVIEELAFGLGMTVDDVVYALEMLGMLKKNGDEYFLEGKEIEVRKVRILSEEGFNL